MFQLRRILLSGLVALLMVGMVTVNTAVADDGITTDTMLPIGGYIGTYVGTECTNTESWSCVRVWIDFRLPGLI